MRRLRLLMGAALATTGNVTDPRLVERIVALSADTDAEGFPPVEANESLELTMRMRAERRFQHALCERTWWRLTGDERATIRAAAMAKQPWYREHPESQCLDMDCCDEIRRVLDAARQSRSTSR